MPVCDCQTTAGPTPWPARSVPGCAPARLGAAALALTLLAGCASRLGPEGEAAARSGFERICVPLTRTRHAAEAVPSSGPLRAAPGKLEAGGFSPAATDIAEVIGVLPLLEQLLAAEQDAARGRGAGAELRLLRLRLAISDRIQLAMLDISSTQAVIDCEGERGDELRMRLQAAEDRRARRLGLTSILVGATTAALSGGLSLAGSQAGGDIAGIVGGTGEASVAAALLFGEISGPLRTERNLLREVWERPPQSELFPRTVWRFLTRRRTSDPDRASPAEAVAAEWRAGDRLGPPGSAGERARIDLLFGGGGRYTVQELEVRDAMLDLLEASIALMSEELRVLVIELAERPATGGPGLDR
ncbi:hypothetical protein JYK14_05065 [Siccirubricoccus sp. KC 17139]|uniref:Uncharacterized protein n=1 Tax=Siccirubricoccus soli TaxID=2899147 RepID=A0ABT1D1P6_9PROT|nr:hypothetical protein [Siccirubricoccus soli]MCO6415547.1 hypothetical protein [Siccirubricoccus soli]MCP2681679.1 hypothetical protein [Siccirubricoccus soli]